MYLAQPDLSAPVCGITDHSLITPVPPSISVCGASPTISYTAPYHLLRRDKRSTQTVAPDLAWSLPSNINGAMQGHDGALITQLFLFWHALFEMQACQCIPGALPKALRGNQAAAAVAKKSIRSWVMRSGIPWSSREWGSAWYYEKGDGKSLQPHGA